MLDFDSSRNLSDALVTITQHVGTYWICGKIEEEWGSLDPVKQEEEKVAQFSLIIAFMASFFIIIGLTARQRTREPMSIFDNTSVSVVESYLDAFAQHDLYAVADYLAEDSEMTFTGADFKMSKKQILTLLGWDVGANGRFSHELITAKNDIIVISLTEHNDFLDLLYLPPLQAEMKFTVNDIKLIQSILYTPKGAMAEDPNLVQRALQPVVQWAHENAPERLKTIYPNGQISYNEESAREWCQLLREWRASQS